MVVNNQSITIDLKPDNIRDIELFVDTVCDQLFINDTYYGNILMSVTELFNYLVENNQKESINITYNSNYENINISFHSVDNQLVAYLSEDVDFDKLIHQDSNKNLFLIRSLVDKIHNVNEDTISLEFDISALHNKIYQKRYTLLKNYFSKHSVKEKVNNHND